VSTPTYAPITFADVKEGDAVRASHAESGSVLVGAARGPLRTAVRLDPTRTDRRGVLVSEDDGWTLEREVDLSHVPTVPGRYMSRGDTGSNYNGELIYNFDGETWYNLVVWLDNARAASGVVKPADLPRDLVRLVPDLPATVRKGAASVPDGRYRDVDGDVWLVESGHATWTHRRDGSFRGTSTGQGADSALAAYGPFRRLSDQEVEELA
jgi:hypothetical protein